MKDYMYLCKSKKDKRKFNFISNILAAILITIIGYLNIVMLFCL